ncbi:hypothetical protein GQ55_7G093600 [Panicum hallii var. hallii]|uniref:Uncharacterized protein n=1 Tax=Panicum hallii var. hallii TaxID=1504633 RepID=A0A2T7CTN2_9POAL|nr:hypothetical protein GQ55_7G093600 [Panicum hallii var. hallii]
MIKERENHICCFYLYRMSAAANEVGTNCVIRPKCIGNLAVCRRLPEPHRACPALLLPISSRCSRANPVEGEQGLLDCTGLAAAAKRQSARALQLLARRPSASTMRAMAVKFMSEGNTPVRTSRRQRTCLRLRPAKMWVATVEPARQRGQVPSAGRLRPPHSAWRRGQVPSAQDGCAPLVPHKPSAA